MPAPTLSLGLLPPTTCGPEPHEDRERRFEVEKLLFTGNPGGSALAIGLPVGSAQTLSFTTSIGGVFVSDVEVHSLDGLMQRADEALYLAKGEGRNRVVFATEA